MSLSPAALQLVGEEGFSLPEDLTLSPLAQESQLAWYLCRSTADSFIIATAASEDATFQVTPLLKNEYALREQLSERWAIRPLAQSHFHGRYALIYDLFSHRTLADFLSLTPQTLADFSSRRAMNSRRMKTGWRSTIACSMRWLNTRLRRW